jgi:long-chain-fatty-acid--CoA ligase ACSBG
MKEIRPTLFFGVPRVWEKIYEKMQELGARTTGVKRELATWAKRLGSGRSQLQQFGGGGGAPCGFACANTLILHKIKQALGLDQAKGCFTAAAPISVEVLNYFASLDIAVYEVFGQSECTGPHTVSVPGAWRVGYCGRPLEGTESMIVPSNGELCYRGRHIFMGYMYMPDKTAETIDDEGYLHSGDVAEFDNNNHPNIPAPSGFMKITGRIKELIITAGGENIPPVLIEQDMKNVMPAISNCMVIGDRRKFLTILFTLMVESDESGLPTNRLTGGSLDTSRRIGSSATTTPEARTCPMWKKYFDDGVKAANNRTTSRAQVVQKWTLLDGDFSEKGGELTPTLKLKRSVAAAKYTDAIEALYRGSED